ncbi:MAG: hypothetical protein IAE67_09885 [Candidatus Competibacteraceae bacterium]|nr:hypothetical protein [Candidatus Competibacteraceae bacterium]
MLKRKKCIILFCLWMFAFHASGQTTRRDSLKLLRDTARVNYVDMDTYIKSAILRYAPEDSTYHLLRFFDPAISNNIVNSSLGNLGTATQQAIYKSDRIEGFDLGMHAYDDYQFSVKKTRYYFTLRPFTRISYFLGMGSEQLLDAMHTQRIIKDLQLGIQYRHINSSGFYQRQDAVHHNFRFFGRYQTDNKRYKILLSYSHNQMNVMENGGLKNDSTFLLNGIVLSSGTVIPNGNRMTYPVMLDSAHNRWVNHEAELVQSYSFQRKANDSLEKKTDRPLFTLMHRFRFENRENRFRDGKPNIDYYQNVVHDSSLTKHRIFLNEVFNEFKAILFLRKKFNSNSPFYAGIAHQFIDVENMIAFNHDSLEFDSTFLHQSWHNLSISGGIRFDLSAKIMMEAEGRYFFAGYNQHDFHLHYGIGFQSSDTANVHHSIYAFISYGQYQPSFTHRFFRSNHTNWDTTFLPRRELHTGLKYKVPKWNLEVNFNTYLLNNLMYYDTQGQPAQFTDVNTVFTLSVKKKFRAWKFYFDNEYIGQYSTSDILRIPYFIGRFSFYFESFLFKKALFMNIGFDLWYNTPLNANSYNPLTSQFYIQNDQTTGNYPFLDIFLNAKIKTVRLYVRLRNVNQRFPDVPYYYTPHHPLQDRTVQFGLSWNFYN